MTLELDIVSTGMVTAVGLDAPSACAAMRARLDGFQETRFLGPGGDWLVGAPVPLPRNFIGEKRLAHMAAAAILEAIDDFPEARGRAALILCLAGEDRPGRPAPDAQRLAARIAGITGLTSPHRTRIVAHGRPSGMAALDQARRMLADRTCDYVMICGVDSYLTTLTIAHYLAERRLLTPDNPNGFIPGEAAAAILCARPGSRGALRLIGLGLAREPAYIYNNADLPLRADGMTNAYKAAFAEAGCRHSDITIKIGDLPGESFWFKQTALAMQRTQREPSDVQPIWAIAASLGNIGAAVTPLMLGWALTAVRKDYVARRPVLIEASADSGACGALVAMAS
ncbi:beta-ketoacyl synthase N-terminal-like domain-containing protein [Amaricoccus solimangrovi]|uniref:3-oxoacyl-ACP synthase n=1 Tax=Amaricoccus solimangrovi TaxID=2589815 RepID=A0A501WP88_9RHOB|nr:beta-ketoacyl synthase N-terminal-like domain-containing protein [Amaricoccus solimangrovi]TPE49107.1 3-oxoacyl-ACP synthase [Amaricoccus solimangrovi]